MYSKQNFIKFMSFKSDFENYRVIVIKLQISINFKRWQTESMICC